MIPLFDPTWAARRLACQSTCTASRPMPFVPRLCDHCAVEVEKNPFTCLHEGHKHYFCSFDCDFEWERNHARIMGLRYRFQHLYTDWRRGILDKKIEGKE